MSGFFSLLRSLERYLVVTHCWPHTESTARSRTEFSCRPNQGLLFRLLLSLLHCVSMLLWPCMVGSYTHLSCLHRIERCTCTDCQQCTNRISLDGGNASSVRETAQDILRNASETALKVQETVACRNNVQAKPFERGGTYISEGGPSISGTIWNICSGGGGIFWGSKYYMAVPIILACGQDTNYVE